VKKTRSYEWELRGKIILTVHPLKGFAKNRARVLIYKIKIIKLIKLILSRING
jgi:hypothetical protein